jgi:hypothetical protein
MSRKNVQHQAIKDTKLFGLRFASKNGSLFLRFIKPMPLPEFSN